MPEIVEIPVQPRAAVDTKWALPSGVVPQRAGYPRKATLKEIETDSPCIFDDLDDAVNASIEAQAVLKSMSLASRCNVLQEMRKSVMDFRNDLAWCAWSETGIGRYEDKKQKMILAAEDTPGVEDLVPKTCTGDSGLTTTDFAPMGAVAAITPVNSPTATVVNNAIALIAAGNSVVFHPHPSAANCSNRAVAVMNQAIVKAGGPRNLVVGIRSPSKESAQKLMKHPLIALNLVTGGSEVVEIALQSGKRSVCAGPANPPAVVDETADIDTTATGIYGACTFDNGMNCLDPKEVFVVETVKEQLVAALKARGAVELSASQMEQLVPFLTGDNRHELTGRDAQHIAALVGLDIPPTSRLLFGQVEASHPLVMLEQLMPVLPLVACTDFDSAVDLAKKAEQGRRHSASVYSQNLNRIMAMGAYLDTALFNINGVHTAGLGGDGAGFTSFSIANVTGEGMTRPTTFVRERRLVCCHALRFV